VGHLLKS